MADWSRKDRFRLTANIGGRDTGVWSQKTGGDLDSEETLFHPGGMAQPVSLGGRYTFATLTLERGYDPVADADLVRFLAQNRGRAKVQAVQQSLDVDGNAIDGARLTYAGTLKLFQPPEVDAESNDAAKLHCEFTIESVT